MMVHILALVFYYLLIFYLLVDSSEISQEFVERSVTLLNGTKESEQSLKLSPSHSYFNQTLVSHPEESQKGC